MRHCQRTFFQMLSFMIAASFLWGCNTSKLMVKSMDPLMEKMSASVNKSDDIELMREGLPYSLIMIDGLLEVTPDDDKLLLRAAEGYAGYSFAFLEDSQKQRAAKLYLKARNYAFRVLKKNKAFRDTYRLSYEQFLPAVQKLGKDDVPAMFWAANAWLSWIGLSLDNPDALADIPKAEALLKRIVELNERFYYGAAHMALGAIYAAQPKALGGDPEKARFHFFRAFDISQSKFLMVYLAYAKFYAVQVQDKQLFEKTLNIILEAPEDLSPSNRFANEVVKEKARALLDDVDDYFL